MLTRRFSTSIRHYKKFKYDPNYKFKCGLEIHTQLKTKHKLFSLSETSFNAPPNTKISYFDVGLPGSQPKLNPEALYLALKAAVVFDCDIQEFSTFDRKHYFYPDQPLGYQITQHYHPVAKNGQIVLDPKFDNVKTSKTIRIEQLQIEQDTGKTVNFDDKITIDLNRSNTPLIEVVTKPDFEDIKQVHSFVKKYQLLVSYLGICSGDLETGAIRVDANINVNDHPRAEIKNLGNTSDIVNALQYEYNRQISELEKGNQLVQETRGWDGRKTRTLRTKEDALDYRYVPDSELEAIRLSKNISKEIKESLPDLPDKVLEKLTNEPYQLSLDLSKFLLNSPPILEYYYKFFHRFTEELKQTSKSANNWIFQELFASFAKSQVNFDVDIISSDRLFDITKAISDGQLSLVAGRILLKYLIKNPQCAAQPLQEIIEDLDLEKPQGVSAEELNDAVTELCEHIIESNPAFVDKIRQGNTKVIQALVGSAMKASKGKIHATEFRAKFDELLNVK
ncbi:PET112 [[Candida] subhashii]|uniref:Glutamyl-tRNA(Gln) amidotransferase subunit B, mitochondrial n=1 Tax=[Candida] subhashii TaxID=561895 RepID=A0A8J5Q6D8_9ASCO|nr:PET112 [[Candida] subhashii]KAG7661071.1 PET112 [[Candida] subhashii]